MIQFKYRQISLILLLSACVSCISGGEKASQDSQYTEEEARIIARAKKEMEIGRNMAGRLLRFYGVHNDKKLVRYINEVGNYVASQSEFPNRRFMFDILNTEDVNAYACPGGYILLTLGAVRNASSEAELAVIIAHEIAHIGKEHMLNQLSKMSSEEMDQNKAIEDKYPPQVIVRKRPDPKKSEAGALLAKYIGGSVAGLNALKAAKAGMSIIMEKGLGAELEYEADVEGVKYSTDGGYYPFALPNFLCRIYVSKGFAKEECFSGKAPSKADKAKESILDKTHPSVPQRIANIMSHLESIDAKNIVGAKGKKRFIKMKKRLPEKVKG